MQSHRQQRTIQTPCTVSGRGYWTGKANTLSFLPAPAGTGIQFVLDGTVTQANVENSNGLSLRTRLGTKPPRLDMIEHVMAALYGLHIDNCRIECTAPEMPGLDGSSLALTLALQNAGINIQDAPRPALVIKQAVRVGDNDRWILAEPAAHQGLEVEYQLDYGSDSPIGVSSYRGLVTPEIFAEQIAPARTFITLAEAEMMQSQGIATHVTRQDLVVFGPAGPVDNQLRFTDECARHKALDVIGDLALCGVDLVGRITARKSGHQLNAEMAQALSQMAGQTLTNDTQTQRQAA